MTLAVDPAGRAARYSVRLACGCRRRMTAERLRDERATGASLMCRRHGWSDILSAWLYVDRGVLSKLDEGARYRERVLGVVVVDSWISTREAAARAGVCVSTARRHLTEAFGGGATELQRRPARAAYGQVTSEWRWSPDGGS